MCGKILNSLNFCVVFCGYLKVLDVVTLVTLRFSSFFLSLLLKNDCYFQVANLIYY